MPESSSTMATKGFFNIQLRTGSEMMAMARLPAGDQIRPPWRSMIRRAIGSDESEAAALFIEWNRFGLV